MPRERSRAICWTYNNPEDDEIMVPQSWDPDTYKYLVYQVEQGEAGTKHLQGYVAFSRQVDFNTFAKWFPRRPHMETAKGSAKQNRKYCTKAEGRIEGPWEFGFMPEQGKRTDLLAMKADLDDGATLKEISNSYFSQFIRYSRGIKEYKLLNHEQSSTPKTIKCLWGSTGVGKTKYCWDNHPEAYWKTRDPGNNQYWDGYDGEDTIIIDEFYGWLPWDFLLRLTDRYPLKLAVKLGTVPCAATTIIFTSNKHPRDWYPNSRYGWDDTNPLKRRFTEITELTGGGEPMDTGNPTVGTIPRFRNGLPSGDLTPANVYSLAGDDEIGIGC